MLIYNTRDLYNNIVQEQATDAFVNNKLDEEAYKNILTAYPSALYTPNYFIRIALGLLTLVAIVFSGVLSALISHATSPEGLTALFFFFGLATYIALELLVRKKQYYNAGVDNVLMFFTAVFIVSAYVIKDNHDQNIIVSGVAFAVCLLLAVRFADGFMSILSFTALFVFVFLVYIQAGNIAKATAPFFMMIVSASVYALMKKLSGNEKLLHYRYCCKCVLLLTLVSFYASANYFIVKELSNKLFNLQPAPDDTLPLSDLFWILTFVIPPVYVVYGILRKDIMFIRAGLFLTAAAVFTFRHYYAVLPAEAAMLIAGAVLASISYSLIKYLTIPKHGFSFNKREVAGKERIDLKALIIAQAAGKKTNNNKGVEFGGGSFGGGGAGENY